MLEDKIKICDECNSEFNKESSEMENLCPECSSVLYGYPNCEHNFKKNRCEKCYWNGKSSEYIEKLKNDKQKPNAQQAFGKIANFVVNTRLFLARNFIFDRK